MARKNPTDKDKNSEKNLDKNKNKGQRSLEAGAARYAEKISQFILTWLDTHCREILILFVISFGCLFRWFLGFNRVKVLHYRGHFSLQKKIKNKKRWGFFSTPL